VILASYAIGCHQAFLYCRGEFVRGAEVLRRALDEAYARGYVGRNILGSGFDLDVVLHRGAGAYICGEETGLLESLEGKRGQPRPKPPFPAISGLYGCPTVVNNVETLSNIPTFSSADPNGTRTSARQEHGPPPVFGQRPRGAAGQLRAAHERDARQLIFEHAGGIPNGRRLKAVIPGGSSRRS
jgi:NADH-quinone oxidoreductase subunit F